MKQNRGTRRTRRKQTGRYILLLACLALVLVAILAVVNFFSNRDSANSYDRLRLPKKYSEYVERYCKEFKVDEYIVYAMMKQESNFIPTVVSVDNARGLMQLTEPTFDWVKGRLKDGKNVTFDDMFDPEINIRYGVYLVSYLDNKFNSFDNIVVAYHAGMNITDRWLKNKEYSSDGVTLDVIPYKDTAYHLSKVKKYYEEYLEIYKK